MSVKAACDSNLGVSDCLRLDWHSMLRSKLRFVPGAHVGIDQDQVMTWIICRYNPRTAERLCQASAIYGVMQTTPADPGQDQPGV
jgi:hypothetical protein